MKTTDTQKIDEILRRLKAVEKTVNPPLWKKILWWVFNHILLLAILTVMAYFTWKTWLVIDHLQTSFENLKMNISQNTNSIGETINMGFEKIKNLNFWE